MKPKPFWPLNHFTVPIGISLLQSAHAQNSRDHHALNSILTMFLEEKEPAGAFNKAQRLIECWECIHFCLKIQGPQRIDPVAAAGTALVERHAHSFFLAPDDVARPLQLVGWNDQREAIGNEKRGDDFERGPGLRKVANGTVDPVATERDRPGLQDAMTRSDSMLIHKGT